MRRSVQSPNTELFWLVHRLPRWEQTVFMVVNLPFQFINIVLSYILFIPFKISIFLKLPFFIIILAVSLVWVLCLAVLLALSFIAERISILRPLMFIIALPILIVAHNLNSLIPSPGPGDVEAKISKWDLIEAFPLTWSLMRFHANDETPTV